uniref:Putative thyroid hormone-inducible hepatic protein spot 14 n=1 Tax=Culex tarsalis TaxID=7177 RepID=A0A1Q3F8A4_CULTA
MSGYTDLTSNIENSRNCLRRIARHDDQEFSNQSILNAMEKFVKTVNAMDETILVPCRLMDRKVGDATDTIPPLDQQHHHHHHQKQHSHHGKKGKPSIREALNTSDLFKLYNMLNVVKVDLLWGRQDAVEEQQQQPQQTVSPTPMDTTPAEYKQKSASPAPAAEQKSESTSSIESGRIKGHIRRPSTVSMASSNSASTLSDSESEISAENDSGIESESNADQDKSTELAKQFRTHLLGLYRSLEQMTEAANYLTARYQSDVGPV